MSEIMEFILEKYGYLIKKDEKGKKYVLDHLIDCLELSPQEKALIRLTFSENGIEIIEQQKEKITKKERSDKVKDFNYGSVESHELSSRDKPVLAKIEYDGDELIFEDYEDLDNFILYDFIPNHVYMKVNKSRNSKAYDYDKPFPSIRLSDIVKLKLSEKEIDHVVNLLLKNNIRIGGTSQDMDSEFLNYDYIRTYATKRYEKVLTREEEKNKFLEYRRTHDPVLREELVIRNLRLVPYVAWKIALRHEMEVEEIESYGYEGLMYAVEEYDPLMKAKFSSYAIPCIEGYIKHSIPLVKNISRNLYYAFQNARYIVEKEWGEKYDGNPEMLEEIIDLMISNGTINPKARNEIRKMFTKELSYEELQKDDIDITTDDLEDNLETDFFPEIVKEKLMEALNMLRDRERDIILWRFGFIDGKRYTLEETGKKFDLSRNRVQQIEEKALRRLRHPCRGRYIRLLWNYDLHDTRGEKILYDNNEGESTKHI